LRFPITGRLRQHDEVAVAVNARGRPFTGEAGAAGRELVPVGKAYSGFTDEELKKLDRWVRNNMVERFGPLRVLTPALVAEFEFDSVHESTRHKSGIALRFPRFHRIRGDKPANEADEVATLKKLIS
jgi:DNA ligase-1